MNRISFHPLPAVSRPNPLASDSWTIYAPRPETNPNITETQPLFREAPLIFPIEIWVVILDILLEPLKRPYLHCTADTVAIYQSRLYRLCNTDLGIWFRVRSVCRTWMRIVDQCPHMTFRTKWDGRLSSLDGVTSVFLDWSDAESALFFRQLKHLPDFTSALTTLEFSDGWNIQKDESPVLFLLEGELQLPRLRCLSLSASDRLSEGTRIWDGIQRKFPNLVSLTLRNEIIQPETITLKRLEILDFWSTQTSSNGVTSYNLPGLKHLSIRGGKSPCINLFRTRGSQLESLFLHYKISSASFPSDFWSIFPNIKTLGVAHVPRKMDHPPPNHPLRNLWIINPVDHEQSDVVRRARNVFHGLDNFFAITISHKSLSTPGRPQNYFFRIEGMSRPGHHRVASSSMDKGKRALDSILTSFRL
ncbi:hypothetical protein CPB86DRAFT_822458 [Serendipita vermifera]|nr:hypothetical protein CPB86DRAFT_822458 [Serendipita vermifera]